MADISMCEDHSCPSRHSCYRYTAPKNPIWQSYGYFSRLDADDKCGSYWSIEKEEIKNIEDD